ncbi:MAG TPA: 50S ribosomal protein L11 methyltransferase [Rhodanobacteraceae bacterium]|nr:50S ribosomal protein L11 methyltransferase [Rhodanobacteraceae bacterium]
MAWLELSLTLRAEQQQRIEGALEDLGALAVTLQDADVDTPDERAIFEPGVGETPLWASLQLQALFDADADRAGLVAALLELVPELEPDQLRFRTVEDQEWTRAWMDTYRPMAFGRRLWIYPWNLEPPADLGADTVIVRLDPGLAFGTGTHPTTALCLEWLDAQDLAGATVVDYGCGSGVLAIAALKLGAARVIGVDLDPQALDASRDNAQRNGVAERLEVLLPAAYAPTPQPFFVANILAGPLAELAPLFAASVAPGGRLALSGILAGQQDELLVRYGEWFDALDVTERDGWLRIAGRRR